MIFVFLDTETTGLSLDTETSCGDEVIQIGGVITDENLKPLKIFDYLCDTTKINQHPKAFETHGITLEFLRQQVKDIYLEEILFTKLPELFEEPDVIVVGYNVLFDINMINQTLRDCSKKPFWGVQLTTSTIPNNGRFFLDLVPFFLRNTPKGSFRQKLTSISPKYKDDFEYLLDNTPADIYDTNYTKNTDSNFHSAVYDALYCYVIFMKAIWKVKLH